jgi:hypothetical protein
VGGEHDDVFVLGDVVAHGEPPDEVGVQGAVGQDAQVGHVGVGLGEVRGPAQPVQLGVAAPLPLAVGHHLDDVDGGQRGRGIGCGKMFEALDHAGEAHLLEPVPGDRVHHAHASSSA